MPPADAEADQRPPRPAPILRASRAVRSSASRVAGTWVAAILVGMLGATLGMALFATTVVRMGPFDVRLRSGFGPGVTEVLLPPFGTVTADTHVAPLRLQAELEEVRVDEVEGFIAQGGLDDLTSDVETAAVDAIPRFAAITLPKAETGSHSWARRWASAMSAPTAMPHGLACLMIATAGSAKSFAARRAASVST